MTTSQSPPSYEPAPSAPLPNWTFHVIEYPGRILNTDAAIKTMGGSRAIEQAFASDLGHIELRYRYNDPFSHPIFGDIVNTANLMLKVTRKRKKRDRMGRRPSESGEDEFEVVAEIVGVIIPNPTDPLVLLRKHLAEYNVTGMASYRLEDDLGHPVTRARHFPPPLFSKIDWPQNYSYKDDDQQYLRVQPPDATETASTVTHRSRRTRFIHHSLPRTPTAPIPTTPPPAILPHRGKLPARLLAAAETAFATRPVFTRRALVNHLGPDADKKFKQVVPFVAYNVTWGPWKDTWVRYGFDPRREPAARVFQVLDLRFLKAPQTLSRGKRLIGVEEAGDLVGARRRTVAPVAEDAENGPNSHVFDGTKWSGIALIQVCDITDPEVVALLEKTGRNCIRAVCDEKDGWFTREMLVTLRNMVRNKILVAQGREGEVRPLDLDDLEEQREEEQPEEEEEDAEEEEAEEEEEEEERAAGDQFVEGGLEEPDMRALLEDPGSREINAMVEEKISKLMASLHSQTQQQGTVAGLADAEEFEYFEDDDDDG
ncbi:tau 95 subunit of transcription factor TFIIIC [Phlyctochytrium bullatum]|nr:tau 95 subunit of transcription factor TFIIIC [Phlyctochytrium bullatum]